MKATGIVRRIDDLGRVVIPKEIRRTLRIREGDALEIFTDAQGGVIFKKYSPVGEMSTFAETVYKPFFWKAALPFDRRRLAGKMAALQKMRGKQAQNRRKTAVLRRVPLHFSSSCATLYKVILCEDERVGQPTLLFAL